MRQSITDDRYVDPGVQPYADRLIVTDKGYAYGDYEITSPSDHVMASHYEWMFCHVDFDGAPDAHDHRIGYANTTEECVELIDDMEARQ